MSLFSRAHDILAAKANKALHSVENPNETLDYSYEQMLDYITRVRQALVEIAAERKRIELQEPQLRQTIAHLGDQAKAALGQGREDLAREALSRQAAAQQQVDGMEAQHQELAEQEQQLQRSLTQLQQQVSHFRNQKEVMKADYAVAQAGDYGGTGDALLRAQDKIATMQARAGATDELLQSGVLEDFGRPHGRYPGRTRRSRAGRRRGQPAGRAEGAARRPSGNPQAGRRRFAGPGAAKE